MMMNKISKINTAAMMIALAFMTTACNQQSKTANPPQNDPAKAQTAQNPANPNLPVFKVATDATRPPFSYMENDKIVGMDVDLLNEIGENRGFNVEFYHVKREDFYKEFAENRAQIGVVPINDPQTKQYFDMANEIFEAPYRVVALKPELLKNQAWKTKRIALVQYDSAKNELKTKFGIPDTQFKSVVSAYAGLSDMLKNEADVFIGDSATISYYMNSPTFKQNNQTFQSEILPDSVLPPVKLGLGVVKGNKELLDRINNGLYAMKQKGAYDKLMAEKWRQHQQSAATASAPNTPPQSASQPSQ